MPRHVIIKCLMKWKEKKKKTEEILHLIPRNLRISAFEKFSLRIKVPRFEKPKVHREVTGGALDKSPGCSKPRVSITSSHKSEPSQISISVEPSDDSSPSSDLLITTGRSQVRGVQLNQSTCRTIRDNKLLLEASKF